MVKRYANMAVVYAVIAMIFGVFYREFTKFNHFTGQTNLSVMHTHYFLLGMFFFLMLMLAEKVFSFSDQKTGKLLIAYQLGLNITGLGFLMRGLTQVWGTTLSKGLDASSAASDVYKRQLLFPGLQELVILSWASVLFFCC